MANRHSHKKLRAEIRARMAETGESYQVVRKRILARPSQHTHAVDLVALTFFGQPVTLATAEGRSFHSITVIRHAQATARSFSLPWMTWLHPRGVN
jgi:hypothetical protein